MITINLLPKELRPRRKITIPAKCMTFIAGGIVVILIFIHILVAMMINREKGKLAFLKKEYERIKPEYERVLKLKSDKENLEAKIALMDKLMAQRLLWSKKLNQLSDLMPPNVWLSSLSIISRPEKQTVGGKEVTIDRKKLLIRGKTYSGKGEKMLGQQGDFMRRIEGHEAFFKDFENVEFISTERETIGQAEIMKFEFTCQLK